MSKIEKWKILILMGEIHAILIKEEGVILVGDFNKKIGNDQLGVKGNNQLARSRDILREGRHMVKVLTRYRLILEPCTVHRPLQPKTSGLT